MKYWHRRINEIQSIWFDPSVRTRTRLFEFNDAWIYCRVSFSLGNNRIRLFQNLMCLPESLKIRHIGFHKRFYFPLTEIPEQQHKASGENNEQEKTFHGLGV